ncbi:DUF6114 domain-containing protein [Streptomyces polygonati]|uniref:DUF6114 domain-containing protein n=1 Tax=Streptomyces polygonati TaxID=1617087 RepID=A0ABV8HKP0_9ACTN
MSAESTGQSSRFTRGYVAFRHWRWQRPFWAGLLTLIAGLPIVYFPYANVTFGQLTIRIATTAGSGSLIIGVLLFVLGLTMWFQPAVRIFAGVASILLALVSIVISNFGGFVVGYLLALVGGALSIAWAPGVPAADEPGAAVEAPDAPAAFDGPGDDAPPAGPPDTPYGPGPAGDPFDTPEPALAGPRPEDETAEENGRHRAE